MKVVNRRLSELTDQQLSWLLAKHICPNDTPVKSPELATGSLGYQFIESADADATLMLLDALDKYKVSVIWRPWVGESGQWWACVEDDPFDSDEVLGVFDDSRQRAAVMALVAHLEEAKITMEVQLPEVLL